MATYAIGDLQGCAGEFDDLLNAIEFSREDRLWLLGDLVNRGPGSLAVMQRITDMDDQCTVVLGNHDLHFLAIYIGGHNPVKGDTFDDLLESPDVAAYASWFCAQKLIHVSEDERHVMTHAGVPHIWTISEAIQLAGEVESVISGNSSQIDQTTFFRDMYGNKPDRWDDAISGMDRVKLITNYLTRMRLIDQSGRLDFSHKGGLDDVPEGWFPWYELTKNKVIDTKILFGHWAALDGVTGVQNILALDTGCVWGRKLTAYCLETGQLTSVSARVQ